MVSFTVPGEPIGKGRPRFTRTGHAYTPERTRDYEALVRMCARPKFREPFDGPVRVEICANYGIPKSKPQKAIQEMLDKVLRPVKKPDADNVAKAILDAINGIAYHDDAQVVDLGVRKFYNTTPGVVVFVDGI